MTLVLEGITQRVGAETQLYDINLTLEPGSLNLLLGPTLAGKTSLMRLMAGLDRPSEGRVIVDGRDVTGVGVRGRSVAMVYQQFVNYPSFTVYENIASPLRLAGRLDRGEIDRRTRQVAEMMRLEGLLDRLPGELSGGQQQRTAIARALIKGADLLLLDEPLVNLDYKLREGLRAEMRDIFATRKTTVIYATTEPLEALMLGGNAIIVDAGRILQTGPTIDVYHRPASIRVGEIFSDPPMNLLSAKVENGAAQLSSDVRFALTGHLGALTAGDYRLGVRSNHVGVTPVSAGDIAIPGTVELAEISGSETFVHVRHGDLAVVAQIEGVHGYELGQAVVVYVHPRRLFAFDHAGRLAAFPDRGPASQRGAA
jgi:glycerol transport system ATP-binding protein